MEAKPLIIVLTVITAVIWSAYALLATKAAAFPLLGLLPASTWNFVLEERRYVLLLPALVYVYVPILAWKKNSKKLAWFIPIAPLIGVASFATQFGVAMSAFK